MSVDRQMTVISPLSRPYWQEQELKPGLVPRGFSETVLAQIEPVNDVEMLWNGAAKLAGEAQRWNGHGAEKAEIKSAQMFCEIQLGQLLGPNPGQGQHLRNSTGQFEPYAHAHMGLLPPERVKDFRRYFGRRDALIEAVRNGRRSRRSLLLLVDQWIVAENEPPTIEQLDIRCGDFRQTLADVENVSLILTDPPYPEEYLPLWNDLGEFAAERLVDGGSLVAYCGQSILPEVFSRLSQHLRYWWTLALIHGKSQMLPGKFVSVGWKPIVWFVKDGRNSHSMLADTVSGGTARKTLITGDDGSWAQSIDPVLPIISALSAPGDLVVDPFAGSGTFGIAAVRSNRRFIGADLKEL